MNTWHKCGRGRRGFTLVELLVVVAIIAVLMALLLPSLAAARASAKAAKCGANLRSIAQATVLFAADHDQRGPGGGWWYPWNNGWGWDGVLNVEYFRIPSLWPTANQRFTSIDQTNRTSFPNGPLAKPKSWGLNCPSGADWDPMKSGWVRSFQYNFDAQGGVDWGTQPQWGQYGLPLDDPTVKSMVRPLYKGLVSDSYEFTPQTTDYSSYGRNDPACQPPSYVGQFAAPYWLGAKLSRFNAPYQIMYTESAFSDARAYVMTGQTLVKDSMNKYTYSTWGADAAQFAFRHPFGKGANFAFFDAHVERLPPKGGWARHERFGLDVN